MECNKCQDGYVYTCTTCFQEAIYDYEFRRAVCNFCEILGDDYLNNKAINEQFSVSYFKKKSIK